MKLYFAIRTWQLPGHQDKGASRVEVPTDAAGLCAWLNDRRVPICLPQFVEPQLADEPAGDKPWIVGPPTRDPPRVSPAFLGDLAAGAEFVPVAKAAEIDRQLARCPTCSRSAIAALEPEHVVDWVRKFAGLDALQSVAEAIRDQVRELDEQIEERTVQ